MLFHFRLRFLPSQLLENHLWFLGLFQRPFWSPEFRNRGSRFSFLACNLSLRKIISGTNQNEETISENIMSASRDKFVHQLESISV
jgi:hypothetical protein